MDREKALQDYQKSVEGAVKDFSSNIGAYLMGHAAYMEDMVRIGMGLLGEQMKKQDIEAQQLQAIYLDRGNEA